MLHVTGARRALGTDPERADEALARAEAVGRDSLDSIRQVMGLLREPGVGPASAPGLADVPALIDGYRTGGLTVERRRRRHPEPRPDRRAGRLPGRAGVADQRPAHTPPERRAVVRSARPASRRSTSRSSTALAGRAAAGSKPGSGSACAAWPSECGRSAAGWTPDPTSDGGWRTWATIPRRGGLQQAATDPERDVATADRPLRVVLVDDQPLVRAGIAFILSTEPGIEVVSEADNGELGVAAVARSPARRRADGRAHAGASTASRRHGGCAPPTARRCWC